MVVYLATTYVCLLSHCCLVGVMITKEHLVHRQIMSLSYSATETLPVIGPPLNLVTMSALCVDVERTMRLSMKVSETLLCVEQREYYRLLLALEILQRHLTLSPDLPSLLLRFISRVLDVCFRADQSQ